MNARCIARAFRGMAAAAVLAVMNLPVGAQPLPQVDVGRIERLESVPARSLESRHVDVWLPPGYSPDKRYNVLYMHDGQMLYDARTTWNRKAWDVHRTVARLIAEGRIADTLVVGVWNTGASRHSEYYPEKFLPFVPEPARSHFVSQALQGRPRADAYLRFLVEELKPAIDRRYPTRAGRAHTFIVGSSMGGLISLYALCEYPHIFGGAAAMSTHWVATYEVNTAFPQGAFAYLRRHLPEPGAHRLYMDRGTTELDALYGPAQEAVDRIVQDRGWGPEQARSQVFEGEGHDERAWAGRLGDVLAFLMNPRP